MTKILPVFVPILALALALSGCSGEPRIDTTSAYALNKSVAEVSTELAPADAERFQAAIATLVDASKNESQGLEALAAALGPKIGGKTAGEVIAIADAWSAAEAKRIAEEQRQAKLAELETNISEYTLEIARLEKVIKAEAAVVAKGLPEFSFSEQRYFWRESLAESYPIIDVRITNNHDRAIETVIIRGQLHAAAGGDALVDGKLRFEFPRGLKPGKSQKMRFEPDVFGIWAKADLKDRTDLTFSVEIANAGYPDGSELIRTYVFRGDDPVVRLEGLRRRLTKAKTDHAALVKEIKSASL